MKVKIVNKSGNPVPVYSTEKSAGCDICADLASFEKDSTVKGFNSYITVNSEVSIRPGGRALIPTGLYIALPDGYELQLRPRSGLALKKGITLLNSPATIDADYRGEIGVILINHSNETVCVKHGERICQGVITNYTKVEWDVVDQLDETARGAGGFGHTGTASNLPNDKTNETKITLDDAQELVKPLLKAEEIIEEPKAKEVKEGKKKR